MTTNRYFRENLAAAKNGALDPYCLVDCWLARLDDQRRETPEQPCDETAHHMYHVLALWGRLQRARPALLEGLDAGKLLHWAETWVSRVGIEKSIELALSIPHTAAWREEAEGLADSYEELIDPVDRAAAAEIVLADLDDADLVLCLAERFGAGDDELADQLADCNAWVADNADAFIAAAVWVQMVAQSLRPDLVEVDSGLAHSAEKFVRVFDAIEDVEAELAYANLSPFHGRDAQTLISTALAVQSSRRTSGTVDSDLPPLPFVTKPMSAGNFAGFVPVPGEARNGIVSGRYLGEISRGQLDVAVKADWLEIKPDAISLVLTGHGGEELSKNLKQKVQRKSGKVKASLIDCAMPEPGQRLYITLHDGDKSIPLQPLEFQMINIGKGVSGDMSGVRQEVNRNVNKSVEAATQEVPRQTLDLDLDTTLDLREKTEEQLRKAAE